MTQKNKPVSYPPAFDREEFLQRLLGWFGKHARPLPWREDYAPYRVWISEIMLQQTQMERGVEYFRRWMLRFPDVASVAAADEDALLKAWEGLGYYSRVRNLAQAARQIMDEFGGEFPRRLEDIRRLPGVGPYTAAAIASIAFNADVPLADANVNRVFSRLFDVDEPLNKTATRRRIAALAEDLLPRGQAREYNQALMEFGALLCRKKPDCAACPLPQLCEARRLNIVGDRPIQAERPDVRRISVATGVLEHPDKPGLFFLQKRREDDAWPGLWEFPGGVVEPGESPEEAVVREFAEETGLAVHVRKKLAEIRHAYTRYRVTLHCYTLEFLAGPLENPVLTEASAFKWTPRLNLADHAYPAGHRKLVDLLAPPR